MPWGLGFPQASALRSARKVQTVQRAPVAVRAGSASDADLTESQICTPRDTEELSSPPTAHSHPVDTTHMTQWVFAYNCRTGV
jgi:hypothetical protein